MELNNLWFNAPANQIQVPTVFRSMNHTYSMSYRGDDATLTLTARISEDLSIVKFVLIWKKSDPIHTINVERIDVPPPPEMTTAQLIEAQEAFGDSVASWCEKNMSRMVGNGECWTLAQQGIDQGTQGAAMSPQGYTHGALIYAQDGPNVTVNRDSIRRGDIIQYDRVELRTNNGISTLGDPDHTAVVTDARGPHDVDVIHQNVGGVKRVQAQHQVLTQANKGTIKVFRVVWKEWAGELKA